MTKATVEIKNIFFMFVNYESDEYARYAVPTPDHFLQLLYILGASEGEKPFVFNNVCNLGSIAMTGFAFGM